ncbi:hypothetical protein HAX54_012740, partial [Datura stramonium]|nr:hypothetical protein [Datura stramonium]
MVVRCWKKRGSAWETGHPLMLPNESWSCSLGGTELEQGILHEDLTGVEGRVVVSPHDSSCRPHCLKIRDLRRRLPLAMSENFSFSDSQQLAGSLVVTRHW